MKKMMRSFVLLLLFTLVIMALLMAVKYVQFYILYREIQEGNYVWEESSFATNVTNELIIYNLEDPAQSISCLYSGEATSYIYTGIFRDIPYWLDCLTNIHRIELFTQNTEFLFDFVLYKEVRYLFDQPIMISIGGRELENEGIDLSNILDIYGSPSEVYWSRRYIGDRVLFYCEDGFLIHADKHLISEVYLFPPISNALCKRIFFNEFRILDPPTPPDVILGPRNPWEDDS